MIIAVLILTASVIVQPLSDEDVLEPSVLNEVEHALDSAPTSTMRVDAASVAFIWLYATNGLSATARAIDLVSKQRNGRWFYSGQDVTAAAVRLLRMTAGIQEKPLPDVVPSDNAPRVQPRMLTSPTSPMVPITHPCAK